MFHSPGSLPRVKKVTPPSLAYNVYTSTQTITIPKGFTKAFIRMCGGGGGAKVANVTAGIACGASGAYLEKFLTGLVAGFTLALTIGAGGSTAPGAGGSSTLVSGSQIISTLTCPGGGAANNTTGGATLGSCSVATGGDFNIPGGSGTGGATFDLTDGTSFNSGSGGSNPLGFASSTTSSGVAGNNYGTGASAGPNGSAVGAPGVCLINWYS